jgi:hypothetical protein
MRSDRGCPARRRHRRGLADQYTGLLLGAAELSGGDGVVSVGQTVFEYHNGVCTDRWVTQRAERGTLVWVVMGPSVGLDPVHPEGTFPSIEAVMETVKDRRGQPPDWTQPYPDGIWRTGSSCSRRSCKTADPPPCACAPLPRDRNRPDRPGQLRG